MRVATFTLLAALAGCNQLFDLDETVLRPEVHDRDDDGIDDAADNCPDLANPLQANADGDPRGDACDLCPDIAEEADHDEDRDGVGDACDVCPAVADFGDDRDGDGIGDACALALVTHRLLFDPFVTLGSPFATPGAPWQVLGDAISPGGVLPPGDPGLEARDAALSDTTGWVRLGLETPVPWTDGHRIDLVFHRVSNDSIAGTCTITCSAQGCVFIAQVGSPAAGAAYPIAVPRPVLDAVLRSDANSTSLTCGPAGLTTSPATTLGPVWISVTATPTVHLRFAELLE